MTARRSKSKRAAVREDLAHEVLDDGVAPREDLQEPWDDKDRDPPVRRPAEPQESKGVLGRIEQGARIAASIGVAGAAIIGVIEYISANEDVRRERALSIVRDWQEDGHIERYTRLQAFVEDKLQETQLPANLPPELIARAYQNLGYNWIVDLRAKAGADHAEIEKDIDWLTLFFGQMETCIASDLCNAEVLHAYFGSEASSFWQYFQGYAQLRREANYAGYGTPVTNLVARFEGMDPE